MNAYITSLDEVWDVAANLGEPWERIVYMKNVIYSIINQNMDLPLSDPAHPGNLYGRANDLEGNVTRMYEKARNIVTNDCNLDDCSSFLQKLFIAGNVELNNGLEVSLFSYMALFLTKYMEYVLTLQPQSQQQLDYQSDSD